MALMVLCLLASNAGLLVALSASGSNCGTQCCRTKKTCCCRKKAADPTRATLSARTCPPGCGQATPAAATAWTGAEASSTAMALVVLALCLAGKAIGPRQTWRWFGLFQRPPPCLSW